MWYGVTVWSAHKETWLSGRKRLTANEVGVTPSRVRIPASPLAQNTARKGLFCLAEMSSVHAHTAAGIRKAERCFVSRRNREPGSCGRSRDGVSGTPDRIPASPQIETSLGPREREADNLTCSRATKTFRRRLKGGSSSNHVVNEDTNTPRN